MVYGKAQAATLRGGALRHPETLRMLRASEESHLKDNEDPIQVQVAGWCDDAVAGGM